MGNKLAGVTVANRKGGEGAPIISVSREYAEGLGSSFRQGEGKGRFDLGKT